MTDIYIHGKGPGGGRRAAVVLLALAVVAVAVWWSRRGPPADGESPESTAESKVEAADPSGTAAPPPPLDDIRDLVQAGEPAEAREAAFALADSLDDSRRRRPVEALLGELHARLVFSPDPMTEKAEHVVRRGDTLGGLAGRYGTTPELIAASNGVERDLIRVGDRLRILQGEFRAEVDKDRNEMVLFLNQRFFKRYPVGTGTRGGTPAGEYRITLRVKNPTWYRPDGESFPFGHPGNLLGTHYLKLNTPGIGLHGTWEPESVGSQSSAGCVRLKNDDIEELYHLLPEGTEVVITD